MGCEIKLQNITTMKFRLLLHRAALLGILVGVLIGCVACTTQKPKQPDPFDVMFEQAIGNLFPLEK